MYWWAIFQYEYLTDASGDSITGYERLARRSADDRCGVIPRDEESGNLLLTLLENIT